MLHNYQTLTYSKPCLSIKDGHQYNSGTFNDNFTMIPEIHCNPTGNVALDLTGSPVRLTRVPHDHAWRQKRV